MSDVTAATDVQIGKCATVDLRELPRGSHVIVVVAEGVAVWRKEGETMRVCGAEQVEAE